MHNPHCYMLFKNILLTLLLMPVFFSASAQKLHAVIFASTEDSQIGDGVKVSFNLLKEEMRLIAKNTDMELETYYQSGKDITLSDLDKTLRSIKSDTSDMLLFYFVNFFCIIFSL